MRSLVLFVLVPVLALLAACANQGPKTTELRTNATSYVAKTPAQVADFRITIDDARTDQSLDSILSNRPSNVARDAIIAAVKTSNVLKLQSHSEVIWSVEGELTRLDWFVPGYDAMLKKALVSSILTGGLGGIAYGSTETPVQGNAVLRIRLMQSGQEVLNREYVGFYEERIKKLNCDTIETKSRVAGLALSDAVEKLVKDLDSLSSIKSD